LVREDNVLLSNMSRVRSQQLVTVQRTANQFVAQARTIPPESSDPRREPMLLLGLGAFNHAIDRRAHLIILSCFCHPRTSAGVRRGSA
jgi:hypothetical protein